MLEEMNALPLHAAMTHSYDAGRNQERGRQNAQTEKAQMLCRPRTPGVNAQISYVEFGGLPFNHGVLY